MINKTTFIRALTEFSKTKEFKYNVLKFFVVTILLYLTAINIFDMGDAAFWRQDASHYYANYAGKFKAEGRWVNFVLFKIYREIPPLISIIICFICFGIYGFLIAIKVTNNKAFSVLFAITFINIPSLYPFLFWPTTSLLAFIGLLTIGLLHKRMGMTLTFVISGIYFFGTFSNFHFLIPLLYLDLLKKSSLKKLVYCFLLWVSTFVLGFIIANLMVYVTTYIYYSTGHGIQLGGGRKGNQVVDIESLIQNVNLVNSYLMRELVGVKNIMAYLFFPFLISLLFILRKNYRILIIILPIGLSVFYSLVYHGIILQFRTLIPFYCAIICMLIPLYKNYFYSYCALLLLFISFFNFNAKNVDWYVNYSNSIVNIISLNDVNGFILKPEKFEKVILIADFNYLDLFFDNENVHNPKPFSMEVLNDSKYRNFPPLFKELGWHPDKIVIKERLKEGDYIYKNKFIIRQKNNSLIIEFL